MADDQIRLADSPMMKLRERRRDEVLKSLTRDGERLRQQDPGLRLWLIGSFATRKWDAYSDVDLVCVSPANKKYNGTNFSIVREFPMDVFSMGNSEFGERMSEGGLFRAAIDGGERLD